MSFLAQRKIPHGLKPILQEILEIPIILFVFGGFCVGGR